MQLQVKLEDLRKSKLFVATPMYGGNCSGLYMKACLDLQGMCAHYGIDIKFSFLFDEFLRSDCTHLLFIDSDILFEPQDVLALIALDKDVIGGPYPKKAINWKNIALSLVKNPATNLGDLEALAGDYVFNPVPGTTQFSVSEPLEVMEIGTGYMLIKREVFDRFREAYPKQNYKPDHVGQSNFDGSRYIHAYFDTVIDNGYTFDDVHRLMERAAAGEDVRFEFDALLKLEKNSSHRYLSEDYMFCQYVRRFGGQIWLCPWMKNTHIGTYGFQGNMPKIAELTGNL